MTRLEDLVFKTADCCAFHQTATVRRADGVEVGVQRSDDGLTFSASLYGPRGLLTRHVGLSAQSVNDLLSEGAGNK